MREYILKLYEPFGGDINVKVDLSNYERKKNEKKKIFKKALIPLN